MLTSRSNTSFHTSAFTSSSWLTARPLPRAGSWWTPQPLWRGLWLQCSSATASTKAVYSAAQCNTPTSGPNSSRSSSTSLTSPSPQQLLALLLLLLPKSAVLLPLVLRSGFPGLALTGAAWSNTYSLCITCMFKELDGTSKAVSVGVRTEADTVKFIGIKNGTKDE